MTAWQNLYMLDQQSATCASEASADWRKVILQGNNYTQKHSHTEWVSNIDIPQNGIAIKYRHNLHKLHLHHSQKNINTTVTKVDNLHTLHPSSLHNITTEIPHNCYTLWQCPTHVFPIASHSGQPLQNG